MNTITRNTCPVCNSASIAKKLSAKDYTVSQQLFDIWECANCTLRFTQNIPDLASVAVFYQADSYISHTDTADGLINKLYHFVRKTTLQRKVKLIENTSGVTKGRLLDIGAGTGAFVNAARQKGWVATGLEPDPATRDRAAGLYKLALEDTNALFELPADSFDAITLWHVLEHVHDLHAYMDQIKLLLNNHGRALIAVPNYTAKDAMAYGPYWAAYDVPRHLYHFSPAAVKNLLAHHELKLVAIKPMWYDSFYISMLSEQYKNGSNNLVKAGWNGLLSNTAAVFNSERCSSVIYVIGK